MITENKKAFFRHFFAAFIILTLIFVPARFMFASVANVQVFSGEENLMTQMPALVNEQSQFFEAFKDSQRVNILLMGTNGNLSDTIILASYDMKNQKVDLISIPRDTYFERAGHDSAAARKINAAYGSGKALGSATAVSQVLLGMPINYYAVVDYKGVANIVDSLGGVSVNVPFHLVYNDPYADPPLHIDIPEGQQVLNGEKAVQFIRYRHGYAEGDIGRVKAQQEFMKSAFAQALSYKLPTVAATVVQNIDSDITNPASRLTCFPDMLKPEMEHHTGSRTKPRLRKCSQASICPQHQLKAPQCKALELNQEPAQAQELVPAPEQTVQTKRTEPKKL